MRTFLAAPALALVLAVGLAGPALADPAKPLHTTISETFADTVCGLPVTVTVSGVDNFTPVYDQAGHVVSFRDTSEVRVTFTAANGQSVTVFSAGQTTGSATTNPDGTVTFVTTYKGLPQQITSASGTMLTQDAGLITLATTVRFNPDGSVTVLSQDVILAEHGPHPEADAHFALSCQVIRAALQ